MAKFTYDVPDDQLQELGAAFCSAYGYQPKITTQGIDKDGSVTSGEMDNPVSPLEFTVACVERYMGEIVQGFRRDQIQRQLNEQAAKLAAPSVKITVL